MNDRTYDILFIGNSYTYFNDMPTAIFKKIAESVGYNVNVTAITAGGWTLQKHSSTSDKCGAQVDAALKNNRYDYVILQEQSHSPVTSPAAFYSGARALSEKIRANGATPVFYSTWGRKSGSSVLTQYGLTNETMTYKLAAAYSAIGEELGIDVAYVGLAFYDVYTKNASLTDLYSSDLSHPSYSGSYLVAMTLFLKMFDVDAAELTYNGALEANVANVLKAAAKSAASGEFAIPAEYLTTSEGIG